jgi:CRISPR type I-E-associated protein CasB/Cse2
MNTKEFLAGLMSIKHDNGKMANLRRVLNSDASRIKGLSILASLGVPVSSEHESIPYKIAAVIFARQKPDTMSYDAPNFGNTLKRAAYKKWDRTDNGHPFDKRLDALVSATSIESLILNHIVRTVTIVDDTSVNYERLINDLIAWETDSSVRNRWIEGYYTF